MAIPSLALIPTGFKDGKLYSVLPESGVGDFDVVRGSGATRINKDGLIETMASNEPRLDYTDGGCPSLLIEPQSTNLVVNSELNNIENIVVSAVSHTISFYGTGNIALSGAHTATLSGTGANDRVSLTFTPSAGTLICTDSGSVDNKQVEALSYSTSYIPTSGAIATRLADSLTGAGDASTFNSTEGVLYFEGSALANSGDKRMVSLSDGTQNNSIRLYFFETSNQIAAVIRKGGSTITSDSHNIGEATDNHKFAVKWSENDVALWVDGVEVDTEFSFSTFTANTLNTLNFSRGTGTTDLFQGKVKDLRTYNTALTDAELITLTTL